MKHLKNLVVSLTCFVVLISSFVFPSYATELVPDSDMLDMGWLYDNGDYYMPGDFQFPSFLLNSEPNYPNFDPDMIPWEDAPNYIKEILYNTPFIPTSTQTYVDPWKIPFVALLVGPNTCIAYVGINLMFGTYYASLDNQSNGNPTGTYIICEVLDNSGNVKTGVEYACCYTATFNASTYEVVSSWAPCSKNSVGDRFTRFSANVLSAVNRDFYCYGGNNLGPGKSAVAWNIYTKNNASYNSSGFPRFVAVTDASVGFSAGSSAIFYQDSLYPNCYATSFVPMSLEEKNLETNKGIWESVKSIPSAIGNFFEILTYDVSSFFDGLGDRISGFFTSLRNYLLYFQASKPEHVNPFSNLLSDISRFFENQMLDVAGFKQSLSTTLNNISSYIISGSGVINTVLSAVPILSAFVSFFVVFSVVRKVVGR